MILRVGARGSQLAVRQALEVIEAIKKIHRGVEFEVVKIRTRGDVNPSPRAPGSPGIFTKEIDLELLRGGIDLAVHSLKDYPTRVPEGLAIAAIPKRVSRLDTVVPGSYRSLGDIPPGIVVGTSSMRRISHILYHRRDLRVRMMRGNVDTRVRKVGSEVGAVVLAEAGLQRLGFKDYTPVDPSVITPQAGQGALAVVAREGSEAYGIASAIDDPTARFEAEVERGFIARLGVGCRAPIGVTAIAVGPYVRVIASLVSPEYTYRIYIDKLYRASYPAEAVDRALEDFGAAGGLELVRRWEEASRELGGYGEEW